MRLGLQGFQLLLACLTACLAVSAGFSGSGSGGFFPTEVVIGFEKGSVFVKESNRTAELCAVVFKPYKAVLNDNVIVGIATEDGRAISGRDYLGINVQLGPLNQTVRRVCTQVPLIDDTNCEGNPFPEDFTATMTTTNPNVTITPRSIGVAIDDRKEPECNALCIGFDRTSYVVVEEVGHVQVCVRITCPEVILREVTVYLSTASQSARAGEDFVALSHVRVGPLGPYRTSHCLYVEIINDGDCERGERFYLVLKTSDPLISFSVNNAQIVIDGTTEHDDCASVRSGFFSTHYITREGDGELRVCIGAFEPERFGARFNLTANTKDGTAVAGRDYVALKKLEIGRFDVTNRIICFPVQIINDNTCGDDPGLYFIIELSTYDNHVIVSPQRTRVYIYDSLECVPVRVGLARTTSRVREDEFVAVTCVTVSSPPVLQREVTVSVSSRSATANEGDDFIGIDNELLTFSGDVMTQCFNITIMNDGNCESAEYFAISLSTSAPRVTLSPSNGYIIITDPPLCTSVEVGLEQQSYTTFEESGSIEVCVRIQRAGFPSTQPFNLLVSTQDGSATSPSDYLPLTNLALGPFDSTNTERCFSVTVVRDSVCEGQLDSDGVPLPEVFSAVVRSEEGSSIEVTRTGQIATIFIEESPECVPVVVGFDASSYTVMETEGPLEVMVNVSSPDLLRRNISVNVFTEPGTATPNVDYLASSATFPLSESERTVTLALLIAEDTVCDSAPAETLTIRLNSSDPNVTLSPGVAMVTILDAPQCVPGTVKFAQASFISSEEVGWAVVCASLSPSLSSSFSLTFSTFDITASAGADYVSMTTQLEFGPNTTEHCQLVLLVADSQCEESMTESFGIRLTSTENGRTAVQDSASVIIYDSSECITVRTGFDEVVYSGKESDGGIVVCAEIFSPAHIEREFFLLLSSSDRDAVAGQDYTRQQATPLGPFSLSQRRSCVRVPVTDDAICEEPEESFVLSLATEDEFINITRNSVTVYIEDSEEVECVQVTCGFEGGTHFIVQETVQPLNICVAVPLSESLRFNFTLNITTVDGSATGGLDFTPVFQTLSFTPGNRRHCVTVTILNDQLCEDNPNEKFTVVVRGNDPRCRLHPSTVFITIDDRGYLPLTDPDCFPLEIYYVGGTPRVTPGAVEIEFNTRGRSLSQTISCDLFNSRGFLLQTIDCTNGRAIFMNVTRKGFYKVRATVITGADSASTSTRVRLDPDPLACSANLINRGLDFGSGGRVTVWFSGVGPALSFNCTLNGDFLSEACTSPLALQNLVAGTTYTLRATPVGEECTTTKKLRESFVYNEPYIG